MCVKHSPITINVLYLNFTICEGNVINIIECFLAWSRNKNFPKIQNIINKLRPKNQVNINKNLIYMWKIAIIIPFYTIKFHKLIVAFKIELAFYYNYPYFTRI